MARLSLRRRPDGATRELSTVVRWFVSVQRPGTQLPFYCDVTRVGAFAVAPDELAVGGDGALFRLFVMLAMYQALRDVVVMRQQRSLLRAALRVVGDAGFVERSIAKHACPALGSAERFEEACDVWKRCAVVDCGRCPGARCHVKDATVVFNRMGDMGKLPTSAWLRLWKEGGIREVVADICHEEASPTRRAAILVQRLAEVHRVGRKLATMFVSAVSTPALAPGLTPWFPDVDGNELVVVDTNVARAVDALREAGASRTYEARAQWLRERAAEIDLQEFRPALPSYSPRLVQHALYAFCSRSNRIAQGDACAQRRKPCSDCTAMLCPFASG
jgi:hypothetical protein